MPTNFQQFRLEMDFAHKKALPAQFEQWMRVMAFTLLDGLIFGSPVGDPSKWMSPAPAGYTGGSFRGSWTVTLGRPSERVVNRPDASGARAKARGARVIAAYKGFRPIWFASNLPYSARIEDGWSHRQAPQGVVRVNLARISSRFRRTV